MFLAETKATKIALKYDERIEEDEFKMSKILAKKGSGETRWIFWTLLNQATCYIEKTETC